MYGLHFREEYDEPIGRELDALIARLKAFLDISFNEDGTLKAAAIVAAGSVAGAGEEEHWWHKGAWTFDDPRSPVTQDVAGLRPPKTPTGTYHNYAPAGIDDCTIIEVEPDGGDVTLTGIRNVTGRKRLLLLRNRDSGNNLTLADNDSGSFDRFQFDLPNNEDLVMGPGNTCWLYYDPARDGGRWTGAITKNVSGGLASSAGFTMATKSVNESDDFNRGAGNNVVVDDAELQFTMAANETYMIRGCLIGSVLNGGAGGAIATRWAGPASPTLLRARIGTGGTGLRTLQAYDVANVNLTPFAATAGTDPWICLFDFIVQNGANAGVFSFKWVSNSSTANSATVSKGSYLEYKKL